MELKVVKQFFDKNTKELYFVGSIYETDDVARAKFLQAQGYVEGEINDSPPIPDELKGNVEEVKAMITSEMDKETLENLLKVEQEGKNRKGVIEHIQQLLEVGDE